MSRPHTAGLAAATLIALPGLFAAIPATAASSPSAPAAPGSNYSSLGQVRAALAKSSVYVADDAQAAKSVSATKLLKTVHGDRRIIVVVLPSKAGTPEGFASELTTGTGGRVAIVLTGAGSIGAAAMKDAPVTTAQVEALAQDAAKAHPGHQEAGLESAIGRIRTAADAAAKPVTKDVVPKLDGNGGHGTVALLVIVAAGVLAVLAFGLVITGRRRRHRYYETAAANELAEVHSMNERLAAEIAELEKPAPSPATTSNVTIVGGTVAAGPDGPTKLAMAEAAERHEITALLLGRADHDQQALHSAKRTVIEGLSAARAARRRLSRPLGPDPLPLPPSEARQVQGQQTVAVGNRTYTGYGQYQPGAGHYFGGGHFQGAYVSGGWYGTPFWRTAQIPSIEWDGLGYSQGYDEPAADTVGTGVPTTVPEGASGGE